MKKMGVIGVGMMGSAIVSGVIESGIIPGEKMWLSNTNPAKLHSRCKAFGANAAASNAEAAEGADVVLLAVKPQHLSGVLQELKGKISPEALLLTVVAGVPISRYQAELGHERIVRVMPNTPAQVGKGVSAWCVSEAVTEEQKHLTEEILGSLGEQIQVPTEAMLDKVTAVSGSGPAYVFLFMEAMIDAGVHMGLSRNDAQKLVLQTVEGSAAFMRMRGEHPAVLRNEVTSPGGTTAEALSVMEREGLRSAVADGMWACYRRTLELGK